MTRLVISYMIKHLHEQRNRKGNKMFLIFATKPLVDRTEGFRFNVFGFKGLYRKRKYKVRPLSFLTGRCTKSLHFGRRSIYIERADNAYHSALHHFAG